MNQKKRIAFLFPGQGAQYNGMGHDFYREFPVAKQVFEEADDVLNRKLSEIVFGDDEAKLTETKNSQPAIFVTSLALLQVLSDIFKTSCSPFACAGLSLGEYTALTASQKLSFQECLPLVQARGHYMHDACEKQKGSMSVILGLDSSQVEAIIEELNMPQEVWCANFNCPGQVVISGTLKGVEAGAKACLAKGAKRALELQVHGAFHSGLMKEAQEKLTPHLKQAPIVKTDIRLATNVTGNFSENPEEIKELLIRQVTQPVRWQNAVRTLDDNATELFIEIGCGKTLSAMNKRIGVKAQTFTIEKVEDLKLLEQELTK